MPLRPARPCVLPALAALGGCAFAPAEPVEPAGEPCTVEADHVECPFHTTTFWKGLMAREVHVQVPAGEPPAAGWPTVIFFQGSLLSAQGAWDGDEGDAFGELHQAGTIAALLAAGIAVVAPEAENDGLGYWETNVWPTNWWWESGDDHLLMLALFEAIEAGELGPLDGGRLGAMGISSGGYMSSRMALAYPGRMRALLIQSASWATCAGPLCLVGAIPADHPPTLFLHGEADLVVPVDTMRAYADALEAADVEVDVVTDPTAGHEWFAAAPDAAVAWFGERL